LRPAFPCNDHTPGKIKLVEREFRRTADLPPAPTRRSRARLCPFRDHAALEFGHTTNHRHAARRRVRVDSVRDRLKRDIPPVEVFKDFQQMER
jgi:hypothetical protein